jgi:hypothetical protein
VCEGGSEDERRRHLISENLRKIQDFALTDDEDLLSCLSRNTGSSGKHAAGVLRERRRAQFSLTGKG